MLVRSSAKQFQRLTKQHILFMMIHRIKLRIATLSMICYPLSPNFYQGKKNSKIQHNIHIQCQPTGQKNVYMDLLRYPQNQICNISAIPATFSLLAKKFVFSVRIAPFAKHRLSLSSYFFLCSSEMLTRSFDNGWLEKVYVPSFAIFMAALAFHSHDFLQQPILLTTQLSTKSLLSAVVKFMDSLPCMHII